MSAPTARPLAPDHRGARTAGAPLPAAGRALLAAVLLDLVSFGIVLPLLPSHAARHGAGEAAVGALVSSYPLMQFLLAPFWGRLSDRVGRRPIVLVGLLGSTLSYLLFAFADGYALLLLSRIVGGGLGATVTVAQATLADVTPPERRARSMGLIGAAFGVGFVVGPAIGGLSAGWSDRAPGLLAAGFSLAALLVAWLRLPETRRAPEAGAPAAEPATVPAAGRDRWGTVTIPFAVVFLATFGFTVMYAVFPLYCERVLGYGRPEISYLFVWIGATSALAQGWLVGRLVPRLRERALMVSGALAMGLGVAALPLVGSAAGPGRAALLAPLLVLSVGVALVAPSVSGYVSRLTPAEDQGKVLGALQSVGLLARIAGPALFGVVAETAGAVAAFVAAGATGGLAAVVAVRVAPGGRAGAPGGATPAS